MKGIWLFVVLLLPGVLVLPACNQKVLTGDVDCASCYQEKPDVEKLYVYLTFNDSIDEIPLILFRGNAEQGDTDFVDTARVEDEYPYWVIVNVDQFYSVKAEYRLGNKVIYAVDGTKPVARLVSEVCDLDCYVVVNNELDLKIKEEFME